MPIGCAKGVCRFSYFMYQNIYWKDHKMLSKSQEYHRKRLTQATLNVILLPPDPPITIRTSPFSSVMITGTIDESGLAPGLGAFSSDSENLRHGEDKVKESRIWLLYTIPVFSEEKRAPNLGIKKGEHLHLSLLKVCLDTTSNIGE